MTTDRDCKHGQLARSCNVCELEAEVAQQAAEIERLHDYDTKLSAVMPADFKDWHEGSKREWPELAAESIKMWRDRANEAYTEVERANALLRQAYAAIEEAVELIGSDECTAKETLAAIKQHLGGV